jgi:hypothetical protein
MNFLWGLATGVCLAAVVFWAGVIIDDLKATIKAKKRNMRGPI